MQKKPNPRLPSCPCDPSRRLHPELSSVLSGVTSGEVAIKQSGFSSPENQSDSGSDSEADSSQPTHPVVPVIGQHLFQPPRHQQQLQGAAMAAVKKFTSPPIFWGSPTEDARQWLERYETISTHNGWGDADKRNNFSMYSILHKK
ncbi:Uncharacterized protein APZ42_032257, partial [Daphnia magna]